MKIVYCINSICTFGGIEHVTVDKANALAQMEGNNVWIAVAEDNGNYPFPVHGQVHIVNMAVNYHDHDWEKNRIQQLMQLYSKKRIHKCKLSKLLNEVRPDVVISTEQLEKSFLPSIVTAKTSVIKELHTPNNYRSSYAKSLYEKLIGWIGTWYDYHVTIKKYDRIVTLTHEVKERHWKGDHRVYVIPNGIANANLNANENKLANKTIVAAGRLVHEKNFASLIRAWNTVYRSHPDWRLEIYGDGVLKNELQRQINDCCLQDTVLLMGYSNTIITRMANSSLYVLSSLFEGFGMVIIEAMSCGLPVVSYDCPYGPKDIISDGKDGFLVPVGDEQRLAERIIYLIEHEDVRRQMGAAALEKSKQYELDTVTKRWMKLFQELVNEKNKRK